MPYCLTQGLKVAEILDVSKGSSYPVASTGTCRSVEFRHHTKWLSDVRRCHCQFVILPGTVHLGTGELWLVTKHNESEARVSGLLFNSLQPDTPRPIKDGQVSPWLQFFCMLKFLKVISKPVLKASETILHGLQGFRGAGFSQKAQQVPLPGLKF